MALATGTAWHVPRARPFLGQKGLKFFLVKNLLLSF
jgi:hypothetical protein